MTQKQEISLPNGFENGDFEDGDFQDVDAEDPSQFTDVGPFGDGHSLEDDLWDVFLTDGDWAEPEPEGGDFWLEGL